MDGIYDCNLAEVTRGWSVNQQGPKFRKMTMMLGSASSYLHVKDFMLSLQCKNQYSNGKNTTDVSFQ
jgi:hypothetical protein